MGAERELLELYLDGQADDSALARLVETLRDDAELRRELVARSLLDVHLSKLLTISLAEDTSISEVAPSKGRSPRRGRRWLLILASIAASLFAAVSIWRLMQPPAMARVTKASNASELTAQFDWQTIREGESIAISAGVVEIMTGQGVRLVLEGPCDCRFIAPLRVHLGRGRLYADVPAAGHGFTVETPAGDVVDLGTRFGIDVEDGDRTEVHVFEGLVTTEAPPGSREEKREVRAGAAVAIAAGAKAISEIALQDKFAVSASPYLERFAYHSGPLAGKGGWVDSGLRERPVTTHPQGLSYPHLARGGGDSLQVNALQRPTSPVGRRWHHRFFSAIIRLDDDFSKGMHRDRLPEATLLSFGVADPMVLQGLRLAAKPGAESTVLQLGLAGEAGNFCPEELKHRGAHFVVIEMNGDQARLWINPTSLFGSRQSPPPDLQVALEKDFRPDWLWIGDAQNPNYAWFLIDEIRGGDTWADVTPTREP